MQRWEISVVSTISKLYVLASKVIWLQERSTRFKLSKDLIDCRDSPMSPENRLLLKSNRYKDGNANNQDGIFSHWVNY